MLTGTRAYCAHRTRYAPRAAGARHYSMCHFIACLVEWPRRPRVVRGRPQSPLLVPLTADRISAPFVADCLLAKRALHRRRRG